MSLRIMTAVFELEITASEKLVLIAMADHAHHDGSSCFPGVGLLARKTSLSRRGVQKIVRRLEQRGLLAPIGVSRGYHTTEYRVTLPNREPGSPSAKVDPERQSRVPRTPFQNTANASAQNGEPCSPEPSGTVKEPSEEPENRQHKPLPAPLPFPGHANQTPPTAAQVKYRNVSKLIPEAVKILAKAKTLGKQHADADCREDLKQWAAANCIPYDSETISKAFAVAEGKMRKTAGTW
jgi:Helix-turn-helix domain